MISIDGKELGKPPYVIGEIASAHDGKLELAKELVKKGFEAGVDAVKVQIFQAEQLVTPNHPKYRNFQEIELKPEEWEEVFSYAKEIGCTLIADVFDRESADLAEKLSAAAFKIHSTNLTNPYLLEKVAKFNKPILLATGGSLIEEIEFGINQLKEFGNSQIILMHGYQGNPAKLENTNLNLLKTLKEKFDLPVGISDHVDADEDIAIVVPQAAAALGAVVVEKHYTLDRSEKGRDYYSSLNPDELERLVNELKTEKNIEELIPDEELRNTVLGKNQIELSEEELEYRKIMKKSIVAAEDIKNGETLEIGKLTFKRAMEGISPSNAPDLVGKKATQDIEKNQIVDFEVVE